MSKLRFIKQKHIQLSYQVIGKGTEKMLCFHGYGQNSDTFLHAPISLQETYTFYAFDLFFHGKSLWKSENNFLDIKTWHLLLQEFLEKENIERYSLMGFSIGAKLVLASLKVYPSKVKAIWLIAPDGIQANKVYVLATKTTFGAFLFKIILDTYPFLKVFINSLSKYFSLETKWMQRHLDSKEKRLKLFNTWLLFRELQYSQKILAHLIQKNNVKTYIFASRSDKIINYSPIETFSQKVEEITLQELHYTHPTMLRFFLKNDFQKKLSK